MKPSEDSTDLHKNILSFFLSTQEYAEIWAFSEKCHQNSNSHLSQNDAGEPDFVQNHGHINENYIINTCISLFQRDLIFYFKTISFFLLIYCPDISSEAEGFR